MTKEQIENELDAMVITKYSGKHLGYYGVLEIFKEVLEGFESRTCENCKYSQMSEYYGHLLCRWENADGFNVGFIYDYDCDHEVPKDFGCNKWESKDD